MKLSTTKLVLFMVFVVCLLATQVTAKHHHKDCDDDDHEDWDDDWKDDHEDWDNDHDDWDNNDWDNDHHPSSTWSSGWPVPTFGQSTAYYPPGAPATVTATYTQVYTATGVPTAFPNQPQYGSFASVTSVGVPVTLAAIMFTMVIVA